MFFRPKNVHVNIRLRLNNVREIGFVLAEGGRPLAAVVKQISRLIDFGRRGRASGPGDVKKRWLDLLGLM